MLGRQHLTLSVMTAGVWIAPFAEEKPVASALLAGGVAIGSLIPDVDHPTDAAIFNNQSTKLNPKLDKLFKYSVGWLFPIFGYVTKYLIFKPSVAFFNTIIPCYHFSDDHRYFAHSWLGILSFTFLTGLYLAIAFEFIDIRGWPLTAPFLAGYALGAFLHLLQDSCTDGGIPWHHPFSEKKLKGSLVTQTSSLRPAMLFYTLLLAVVGVYYWPFIGDPTLQTEVAIGLSVAIWLLFAKIANVRVKSGHKS
jgi:membrane-bound metal-dependent hydrolase YbcI (DUF457 family)